MVLDGDAPFLPQEIITNILTRLPVKSLIRFQCVCKHWKNLFKTQSFIEDHLRHSSHQNPLLLFDGGSRYPCPVCQQNVGGYPWCLYLLDREMQFLEVDIAPLNDSLLDFRIIGSSNGLLCVEICVEILQHGIYVHSLLLWNPAIREVRQVPRTMNIDFFEGYCRLGFGFSPIVNDYKIVRIYTQAEFGDGVNRVEVYSLSTGSWKEVEFGIIQRVIPTYKCTATVNGVMFWSGLKLDLKEEDKGGIELIISFDIAMELFALIPWPAVGYNSSRSLTVYENKLAVFAHSTIGEFESSLIDLWVLEEGIGASGERWSWRKKYSSGPCPCLICPLTIWGNEVVSNVVVLPGLVNGTEHEVENNETKFVLFNLTIGEFKMFAIHLCYNGYHILNYAESLVPVGNFHIEEP